MHSRTQPGGIKRIVAAVAALAAVPAIGLMTATAASAESGDTPDNKWVNGAGGSVMWNDYDNEDHDRDLDNIWIDDYAWDNKSVRVTVEWGGKEYTAHAYNNEIAKVSFGNVPNGERVYFETCEWQNGENLDRCMGDWFYE